MVQRQAAMLSFVEAFWLMAALFAAMLPFLALLRHTRPEQPRAKVEEPIEIPWQPRKKEEEAQPDELILV